MFPPLAMNLTFQKAFPKGLAGTLLMKDVEQKFFRLLLRFYCVIYLIAEVLTKQLFSKIFQYHASIFWLELFMAPASALSLLWYDMVLLVCPTRSTVCWTKLSKSSMVKSTSSSGAVVAFFIEVPWHQYFSSGFFEVLYLRYILMFSCFLSEHGT